MTFVSSPNAGDISDGDMERLCSHDDPGRGSPYARDFTDQTWAQHVYDRHWYGAYGTRYLISESGFVVLGSSGNFFDKVIRQHFCRMYAQMGLLLHFQHAMLIAISGWVSEAVAIFAGDSKRDGLRHAMQTIQQDFVIFVQRYRFTNVSNQIQARELYAKWQQQIGIDSIYKEVAEQLKDANDFLDQQQQQAQTEAGLRLNKLAALGLGAGIPLTFLGAVDAGKIYGRFKGEKDDAKTFNCTAKPDGILECKEDKPDPPPPMTLQEKSLLLHDGAVVFTALFVGYTILLIISSIMDGGKRRVAGLGKTLGIAAGLSFATAVVLFWLRYMTR